MSPCREHGEQADRGHAASVVAPHLAQASDARGPATPPSRHAPTIAGTIVCVKNGGGGGVFEKGKKIYYFGTYPVGEVRREGRHDVCWKGQEGGEESHAHILVPPDCAQP